MIPSAPLTRLVQALLQPLDHRVEFPVYQLALLLLAIALTAASRRSFRESVDQMGRRLAQLGTVQAALAGLGLVTWLAVATAFPELAAARRLLELLAAGGILACAWRVRPADRLPFAQLVALSLLAGGAAGAWLLGGVTGQPPLSDNRLAALAQLGFLAGSLAVPARLLKEHRRRGWDELTARCARLETELSRAGSERESAREAADESQRQASELRLQREQLLRHARNLERVLQLGARVRGGRTLNETLDEIAQALRESLGFRMVLLRTFSPSTQSFEARAFAGISDEGKAHLAGLQVSMDAYRKLTQPRFRVSQSYFISHEDEEASEVTAGGYTADLGPRDAHEWHEDDTLIVPLLSQPEGEVRGYLSVDDPVDRHIPDLETLRQLERFAGLATAAIEGAELAERLAKSNHELARASALLKHLNEMKSNFVANVSHELRTPLTSIKAYTETLVNNRQAMPDEVRNEFLGVIHQESEKLTAVIDSILALSRLEDGPARINREDSNLAAIVRREAAGARREAQLKDIALELTLPAHAVSLNVDAAQIAQVVAHLLDNAVKFTPAGGTVRVTLIDGVATVRLTVEDTGIGIPEDKMEFIFDRFYQADGSSTREHGGQGVGLAICRDIVQWHDGQIWAENVSPRGARLTVALPRRNQVVQRLGDDSTHPVYNNPLDFLEKVVHWVGETLGVRNVSLMAPDAQGEHLVIEAAVGLPESVVNNTRLRRGEGISGKVWVSGRTLLVNDIAVDGRFGKRASDPQYSTASLLSVPLLDGLECVGVVNVNNRLDGRALGEDDRLLLEALAPRVGHLLAQQVDYRSRSADFAALRESLRITTATQRERFDRLTGLCHEICLATARRLKLPQEELENLAFALQHYDVGLARVSPQLLRKPGPLTADERELIHHHVRHGIEILAPLNVSAKVRQIIAHHHERYDGAGYPDRLEGEAIPIGARLLALADTLNALLQGRPYRPARSLAAALAEIEARTGSQFCPRLAGPFLLEARARAARVSAWQQGRYAAERPLAPSPAGLAEDEAAPLAVPDAALAMPESALVLSEHGIGR